MDRNSILKKLHKEEDRLIVSKALDKAERSIKTYSVTHTDFLDPYQRSIIEKALDETGVFDYEFDGGFEGAERVILVFRPDFIYTPEGEPEQRFLKALHLSLNGRGMLTHRDYLGSLMGLGIKREKVGDILVRDESCTIIVMADIADYIKCSLFRVGNIKADVEVMDVDEIEVPQPKTKEIKTTVASLRLDSIAGAGFGISRSKAAQLIKADKVNLNWVTVNELSRQVNEGDTISIRGRGRVVLEQVNGKTRRDRISIVLKRMV